MGQKIIRAQIAVSSRLTLSYHPLHREREREREREMDAVELSLLKSPQMPTHTRGRWLIALFYQMELCFGGNKVFRWGERWRMRAREKNDGEKCVCERER